MKEPCGEVVKAGLVAEFLAGKAVHLGMNPPEILFSGFGRILYFIEDIVLIDHTITYYVEYDSMTYIVRMPINSDSIVSVSQKRPILTEDEADSLRNNGVDLLIKIPLDSNVTLHLEDICKRYRSIWQSYHRYVSLGKVQVDCKGNVLIRLLWKKSDVIYNIYISQSDGLNSLSNFPFDDFVTEKFYLDDYVQIKKDVYYRKVDMMEYNIANKRNFD